MTLEEKVAMANTVRSRDRFGPVSPEELAALPGTEKEMWVEVADGGKVHVFEERVHCRTEKRLSWSTASCCRTAVSAGTICARSGPH